MKLDNIVTVSLKISLVTLLVFLVFSVNCIFFFGFDHYIMFIFERFDELVCVLMFEFSWTFKLLIVGVFVTGFFVVKKIKYSRVFEILISISLVMNAILFNGTIVYVLIKWIYRPTRPCDVDFL
jgi:hypothetical protein